MKKLITILYICHSFGLLAQQGTENETDDVNAMQVEDLSQENESESENDYDIQQLNYLRKHPLDINGNDLHVLPLLDPLLISNLEHYRQLLGSIIDIHELQAVPGFTVNIIKEILPFVTVKSDRITKSNLKDRLKGGEHTFLFRPVFNPEIQNGFTSLSPDPFSGSRPAFFIRYKYRFKNLLQYGFLLDKDAGEKIFVRHILPEFVSFHVFARKAGIMRSLAIGDYTVNLGQGLIHWQSQAFRKSSAVISIKRQREILRPYHSAGEYNFHRGIGLTMNKRKWEFTIFTSHRKVSANIKSGVDGRVITSFQTSGLHRNGAELEDRNSATIHVTGSNVTRSSRWGHAGFNVVSVKFSVPVLKRDEPYNLFSIKGRSWENYSFDYDHTLRNVHMFGELATDKNSRIAIVNGAMASLSREIDVALLHRSISKSYQSFYGNAFTENTLPVNEKGFYMGVSVKPHNKWKIDLYADIFSFGWLKYRLDAPSTGLQYLVQVSFKPTRQTEIFSRFRYRMKPLNIENDEEEVPGVLNMHNWRTQMNCQVTRSLLLRCRIEVSGLNRDFLTFPQSGYLFFTDLVYKPFSSWLSGNLRLMNFEADSYDTRIYAYENDVLFVSSTPSFYNKGIRCYINIKGNLRPRWLGHRELTISFKAATSYYLNLETIGTGAAMVAGNRISVFKFQTLLIL